MCSNGKVVLTFLLLQIQEYKFDMCKQGWGLMAAIKFMSVRNDTDP